MIHFLLIYNINHCRLLEMTKKYLLCFSKFVDYLKNQKIKGTKHLLINRSPVALIVNDSTVNNHYA